MKKRLSISKENCCGCTACENICAHSAIKMNLDELGFLYPAIDNNKCIDCGLCRSVCQFRSDYNRKDNYDEPFVYAVRHKNQEVLSGSQSGAAFYTFSEYCLKQGYVLYGAILDETFRVKHLRATTYDGRDKMLYSKYVQSDIVGIFKQVKDDLKNEEKVLFSGTPCQIAGLKSFIGEGLLPKLLTIDLVCHGVPSPRVWEAYINWIEKKYGTKIEIARFRDKSYGWNTHVETFKLANGKFLKRFTLRNLFYAHYMVRESCSKCHFTNLKRVGDITIGDFWGWFNISDKFHDNKGVSLILVNSDKGKELLSKCASDLEITESNTTDCLQPQLKTPIQLNIRYNQFVSDFSKHGFEYVGKKYGDLGWRYKKDKLSDWAKRLIKKLLFFR